MSEEASALVRCLGAFSDLLEEQGWTGQWAGRWPSWDVLGSLRQGQWSLPGAVSPSLVDGHYNFHQPSPQQMPCLPLAQPLLASGVMPVWGETVSPSLMP